MIPLLSQKVLIFAQRIQPDQAAVSKWSGLMYHLNELQIHLPMIIDTLKKIFSRDLEKLRTEIELYRSEEIIWHIEKSIANSGGNLCLHLVGNLNAYIGVGLAKIDYLRRRDLEFTLKDVPRGELLDKIDKTMIVVENGLNNLSADQLYKDFPIVVWEKPTETEFTLVHLATHLTYHLGQINYHRRLLDK